MNIDHTPKELAEAIKHAKSINSVIEVKRHEHSTYIRFEVALASGFGKVEVRMAKSHRRTDKMRRLGARWLYGNLAYTTFYYEISNDPWTIEQAEKLGAVVMKKKPIKAEYVVCTKAQKEWYDKNVMKR